MRRDYPENVRVLLSSWEAEKTVRFVESVGISSRNWRMFCLEAGVVDGRKWKQREIAAEYKLTIARVSKILETARKYLSGDVGSYSRLGPIREYRAGRRQVLWNSKIVNASVVNMLTSMFRKHTVASRFLKVPWPKVTECLDDEFSIEFIADGKRWRKVSAGRLGRYIFPYEYDRSSNEWSRIYNDRRVVLPGYTIFWMVEDIEGTGNNSDRLILDRHCIRDSYLVFDCAGSFWVMDKVEILRKEKRLVVRLKPAEYGNSRAKGGQQV